MEGFVPRDDIYALSMSDGKTLLLHQLATGVLVVLDDPGEYATTSSMVNTATETEQRRDEPRGRTLHMLLPSMSEDNENANRLHALTEDSLHIDKSARLHTIVDDLDHIVHGEGDTLRIQPEAVWSWLGALNDVRLGLVGELDLSDSHNARHTGELALSEPTGERSQTAAAIYILIT